MLRSGLPIPSTAGAKISGRRLKGSLATRGTNHRPTGRITSTLRRSLMSQAATLDRIGVGIDTARYGHRVSFLRPDRLPAAKPLTVLENRAGYQALQARLESLH